MASPTFCHERAQFRRRLRTLDLEELHHLDLAGHANEQRHRQIDARQRGVLHHDRNADVANAGELLEGLFGCALEKRAMIGRHHHHHGRAEVLREPGRATAISVA
jgi:hypothetical protein